MASFTTKILAVFKADTRNLDKGTRKAARGFKKLRTSILGFGQGLRGMNASLTTTGFALAATGLAIRNSIRSYSQLSRAQTNVRAAFATNRIAIQAQDRALAAAGTTASQYAYSSVAVTEELGNIAEMGLEGDELITTLTESLRFARAANIQLSTASRAVVDQQRRFNIAAEDSGRISDVMTIAARANSTSVEQLASGMRMAGTEAASFGYSFEQTTAALAGLSRIGLRATQGGTALRRGMIQMRRAAGGMNRQLTSMLDGYYGAGEGALRMRNAVYEADGSQRSLTDATYEVGQVIKGIRDPILRTNVMMQLFGVRGQAAAAMLTGLTENGRDWTNVMETLGDQAEIDTRMQNTLNASMSGFYVQAQQVKHGLQELSVLFGKELVDSMGDANKSFGTHFRDLVFAAQYADPASRNTNELRERYRGLTDVMKDQGKEFREVISGLAQIIKYIAKAIVVVGRFAGTYPKLTAAIIGFGIALGPVLTSLQIFGTIIAGGAAVTFGLTTALAIAAVGLVAFNEEATRGILIAGEYIGQLVGIDNGLRDVAQEYDAMGQRANEFFGKWLTDLPIIGRWLRFIYRFWSSIGGMFGTAGSSIANAWRNATTTSQQEERYELGSREAIQRGSARRFDAGDLRGGAERQSDVSQTYLNRSVVDLASLFKRSGQDVQYAMDTTRRSLLAQGATTEESNRISQQVGQSFENLGMNNARILGEELDDMRIGTSQVTTALLDFSRAAQTAAGGLPILRTSGMATTTTPARDVSVRSTGFLPFPVSAGDMLVDSSELANAIGSTTPGSMIPSTQRTAGTPQSTGPTELKITIESPIQIDGREVARAIGRHVLQINQRRGAETRPGSRRRVAEQGVS